MAGSAGAAGSDEAACVTNGNLVTLDENDADVVWTVTGTDGTYIDHCDGDGNLVQYGCELGPSPCPPPPPGGAMPAPVDCAPPPTGVVLSKTYDCRGTCRDGVCASRCPDFEDHPTYLTLAADGSATFRNDPDPRVYACELALEGASVDCSDPDLVGTSGTIVGLGVFDWNFCTDGVTFTMVLGSETLPGDRDYQCSYSCAFQE